MSELNLPQNPKKDYENYTKRVERIKLTGHEVAVGKLTKRWLEALTALSEARDELHKKDCIIGDLVKEKAEARDDLLTASTRDTAQLELIGKLEAENKGLRIDLHNALDRIDGWEENYKAIIDLYNLEQDSLSKDS